ncbi:hypothetical protein GCM10011581_46320 [Saccharopolyspora subtropica]|uniref:Uncharacterized protein n=1 Tax=Saccharopolyspora thermophila TaxID=89367 RepID=A0A917K9U8_9PSEU|nr:hypothetical protein GCM10011581_46320 [Saccharopolyspora subtropica]
MDGIVEDEWRRFLADWRDVPETEVAELVAAEPDRHDWRVVDAALDRITCDRCGDRLGRGPVDCAACELAHGLRYAAIETDRPGVPPGNEHAVRVNVSVVRRPQATSAPEVLVRRLLLPALLVGFLPTTAEAQRLKAVVNEDTDPGRVAELVDELVRSRGPLATRSP